MERLEFTLLTDGSSDAILLHPLRWLLEQHLNIPVEGTWAELRLLPSPPSDLRSRIMKTLDLYPCDILFVHRDAEREPHPQRVDEILAAASEIADKAIPIVPVRMQEAWLLFDESAIRLAAGNPNGNVALGIPPLARLESLPNPKEVLHDLLVTATKYEGRRRKRFNPSRAAVRLGEILEDFTPLRALPAFEDAERRIVRTLEGYFPTLVRKG